MEGLPATLLLVAKWPGSLPDITIITSTVHRICSHRTVLLVIKVKLLFLGKIIKKELRVNISTPKTQLLRPKSLTVPYIICSRCRSLHPNKFSTSWLSSSLVICLTFSNLPPWTSGFNYSLFFLLQK